MTLPPYVNFKPALLRDGTEVTRLLFVRHAQPEVPPEGVLPQAWMDAQLSETGLKQAAVVARHLEGVRLGAIVSSALRRARRTAEEIAARHEVELEIRPALAEVDTYADLPIDIGPVDRVGPERWAAAHEEFARRRRWEVFGLGETGAQLRARVLGVVDDLIAAHPGTEVAVVCHGGAINAYLAHILGTDADIFFLPAHGSITVVLAAADGRRVLESVNERHHLEAAGLLTY